jgi:hypothetical protein
VGEGAEDAFADREAGVAAVTGGNHFAKAYKSGPQPVSVSITSSTKVNRQGDTNPADLKAGDRVNFQARACRADLAGGKTLPLTAMRVTAHPANP